MANSQWFQKAKYNHQWRISRSIKCSLNYLENCIKILGKCNLSVPEFFSKLAFLNVGFLAELLDYHSLMPNFRWNLFPQLRQSEFPAKIRIGLVSVTPRSVAYPTKTPPQASEVCWKCVLNRFKKCSIILLYVTLTALK